MAVQQLLLSLESIILQQLTSEFRDPKMRARWLTAKVLSTAHKTAHRGSLWDVENLGQAAAHLPE